MILIISYHNCGKYNRAATSIGGMLVTAHHTKTPTFPPAIFLFYVASRYGDRALRKSKIVMIRNKINI